MGMLKELFIVGSGWRQYQKGKRRRDSESEGTGVREERGSRESGSRSHPSLGQSPGGTKSGEGGPELEKNK